MTSLQHCNKQSTLFGCVDEHFLVDLPDHLVRFLKLLTTGRWTKNSQGEDTCFETLAHDMQVIPQHSKVTNISESYILHVYM